MKLMLDMFQNQRKRQSQKIEEYNKHRKDLNKDDKNVVVGSMDIVKWYPSMIAEPSAREIRNMLEKSEIEFKAFDFDITSKFLGEHLSKVEIIEEGMEEILYLKKEKATKLKKKNIVKNVNKNQKQKRNKKTMNRKNMKNIINEVTDKDNTTSIGSMNEVENENIADIVHTNPLEEPNNETINTSNMNEVVKNNKDNTTSIGSKEIIENDQIVENVNRKPVEGRNKRFINPNNMNYEDENIVFNVRNDQDNTTSIGGMEIIENEDIVEYVNRKQLEGQNKRLINPNNLNDENETNIVVNVKNIQDNTIPIDGKKIIENDNIVENVKDKSLEKQNKETMNTTTMKENEENINVENVNVKQTQKHKNGISNAVNMKQNQTKRNVCKDATKKCNERKRKTFEDLYEAPRRKPTKFEERKMISKSLEILIISCMKNHVYKFENKIRKQSEGGHIGLGLTGEVADCFMIQWEKECIHKCKT